MRGEVRVVFTPNLVIPTNDTEYRRYWGPPLPSGGVVGWRSSALSASNGVVSRSSANGRAIGNPEGHSEQDCSFSARYF
jgi:hypothetical protein